MRIVRRCVVAGVATTLMLMAGAPAASAHEGRHVGRWHFTVGWGTEPAFAGAQNSVSLHLLDHDDKPVNDLGDTLKVDVAFGSEKRTLSLEPAFRAGVFGEEGSYRANLLPTRAGTYTFTFVGTIKGDRINATFRCGDKTFDCINDPAEIQFPAKDPSNAQLAERIDREVPRLETSTQRSVAAVRSDADSAGTLGLIGIVAGALGIVVALIALMSARRKAA